MATHCHVIFSPNRLTETNEAVMMVAELLTGNAMAAGKRAETLINPMPAIEQQAIMTPSFRTRGSKTDRKICRVFNSINAGIAAPE